MTFFSSALGNCRIDSRSMEQWQWNDFCKLTGVQGSSPDTDSPEVCIQNMSAAKSPSPDEVSIFPSKNRVFLFARKEKNFRILHAAISKVRLWQYALFCAGISAIMRRGNCMMLHGALLEMPDGSGVALCGSSGMGKSTTARRWQAVGGVCYADDLFWVVWHEDGITAYPLPTWSRCMRSTEGEYFPLNHGIPLKAVVALLRGQEHESLEAISPLQFRYAVYGASIFYEQEFIPHLPSPEKEELVKVIQQNTLKLFSKYPAEGLYATLDGDIRATLRKFL